MCCGKKRARAQRKTQTQQIAKPEEKTAPQPRQARNSQAHFQYLGKTGLTVLGPWTRKRYRFDHPGAIVAIDQKDTRAIAAVSILRQVDK
jgi:hypothetical protein